VKCDQINFIFIHNKKNCSKSIVRDICFHNELSIRDPVYKNRYKIKCLSEGVESITAGIIELLEDIFLSKVN